MKIVKQEDVRGCGAACTAAALNISYQKALSLFQNGRKKAKEGGFYCREIVSVLKNANLDYRYKYVRNAKLSKRCKVGAIVFIRRSKTYPAGHYLYRGNSAWMDPWINFPDKNIQGGWRTRLPEKPIYVIFPA